MTDVDQILRDHATAADRAEPAPDGWDRLVARLEDEPPIIVPIDGRGAPAPTRRPGRWALAAAAAIITVVVVAGAVALSRPSGDADDLIRPAATTAAPTTAAPTTAPAPTETITVPTTEPGEEPYTGRPPYDGPPMPDRIVAIVDHDGDGLADLVRLTGIGAYEDVEGPGGTTATGLREPEVTMLLPGSAVAPDRIVTIDVGPGELAYVGVGDEVRAIGVADGVDHGPVGEGREPAVSGDGDVLATIVGNDIHVDPVGPRPPTVYEGPADGEVTRVSLSPDGTRMAREVVTRVADGLIASTSVEVTELAGTGGWESVERSSGIALPVFIGPDDLGVGLDTSSGSGGQVIAGWVGMADLTTGKVQASVGIPAVDIDATPDGGWVIADFDGGLRAYYAQDGWLWDSGTILQLDGLVDAAW
ncbi:MAG TPA: hypothetical protein VGO60_09940 [Iamia sp.]|jgi:hypothetical protein|nr:hypothetical protein [Iamia sp.]